MSADTIDLDQQFTRVVDTLTERFDGIHDRSTVQRVVAHPRSQLEPDARVTSDLPALVSRRASDRLTGRATLLPV